MCCSVLSGPLVSESVYSLSRTSQGSCNLAERTAEGSQWSKLGEAGVRGGGLAFKSALKNRQTGSTTKQTLNNIREIRGSVLRRASWLSLSNMTSSEVISVYVVQCASERARRMRAVVEGIKRRHSSPFLARCSYISLHDFKAASNAKPFYICNAPWVLWLWKGPHLSTNSLFLWCKQFQCGFWIKLFPSTCGYKTLKVKSMSLRIQIKKQLNHTSAETVWNLIYWPC